MRWLAKLRLRMRTLLHRNGVEQELDSELRFHLEQQIAENFSLGMSPEDARLAALRSIGGMAQISEECRDARGLALLESLLQDVRYGLRQLRRAPAFTAVAVLTLALGIGANTAIFTVMNALMFKTLPVPHPEELVQLNRGGNNDVFTYAMFRQIEHQQDVFSGIFAVSGSQADLASGGARQLASGILVSGNYFSTLNVPAVIGRSIEPQDDQRGSANVIVISYGFWQRRFGADPNVVGRTISLNKKPFQIIGVAPRGFFGSETGQEFDYAAPLWAVEVMEPTAAAAFEDHQSYWLNVLARLKPGVTIQQARARLQALAYSMNSAVLPPQLEGADRDEFLKTTVAAVPASTGVSQLRSRYGHSVILLSLMVGVVLLIACANIANLLLARAHAREHEYAVRAALGARRLRVLRQVLTESLMLSVGGVTAGLLFARISAEWLVRAFGSQQLPGYLDLRPDLRVILFLVAIVVLTAILFGLAPAWRLGAVAPHGALKEKVRTTTGRGQGRGASVVIAIQVALCVLLLLGAELLVRSVRDLMHQDLGFHPDGVLLVQTDLGDRLAGPQRDQLAHNFLGKLQALPGVLSASRSVITPISGMSIQGEVEPVGAAMSAKPIHVYFNVVSPRYFQTLGVSLLGGRDFDDRDTAKSPRVAVVDEAVARKLFPNQNPIGQSYRHNAFTADRNEFTIKVVGLAKLAKYRRLRDDAPPTIYVPGSQNSLPYWGVGTFEVRFSGPADAMTAQIEKAGETLDPTLSFGVTLLSAQVRNSLRLERLMAQLSSIFTALALLLAAIGIYGVVAYAVTRRTNEIGIRMALGARRADVVQVVLREAVLVVAAGIMLGLPAAFVASRLIKALLFGVRPADPLLMILTVIIMAAVALLASYLPARRASRIDPMVALRYE